MSAYPNENWHNANGGGLPYRRPPTVDEALPYSPFTSIIPFSPDIIPFPTTEPPTPPSTLTPDQQKAANKAVGILNDEVKGQSTAQHLHDTLNQLRSLLHRDKLPEYHFKPMPQLATPPPDSPVKDKNGNVADFTPRLSPFASMLLKQTDVVFKSPSAGTSEASRKEAHPRQPSAPRQPAVPQSPATVNGNAYAQNANVPYPPSAPSSAPTSIPARPSGPAVLIKPKTVNRDEFKYIESIDTSESLSQRNEDKRAQAGAVVLKPHEREIADRKIEELDTLVTSLTEDKDDLDESRYFTTVNTPDADFSVLNPKQMETLSEKVSSVVSLGRFAALPVDLTMYIQSLLSPTVTAHTKNGLFPPDENTLELTESIGDAKSALRASKLLLETMIEGRDDYRMRREEIVDIIIDLIKLIKDACVGPIIRSRRSGESHELFNAASGYRSELQMVLRLCGSVLARFATLIGKYNLSDRALNTLEYLTLELLVEQNSENEKDSVFTIKKFELFRQKAMDVLAQIFARYPEQRTSILSGIFSNLEKLPDKKASARQFVSAREVPIMTISALFMRFVQVVATNPAGSTSPNMNESVGEEDASDYEPGTSTTKAKRRNQHNSAPALIAQQLVANANNTANTIATSLCERASNTSKSGDKPFRNLLDLFIDDFCNVLGSPQWPAAVTLLQLLLVRMQAILQDDQGAKHSVVDKDMALTAFARIGCGVIDFRDGLKKMKQRLDISQSDLSAKLDRLANDAMSDDLKEGVNDVDVLAFDGPYRMVLESLVDYLDLRPAQEDPHLQAVRGYHVSSWLSLVAKTFPEKDDNEPPPAIQEVRQHLDRMIMDPKWLSQKFKFQPVSDDQSKLAAGIITLQSTVCRFLPRIVSFMQRFAQDKNSSKLRTRGTTGLQQLLDKDPRVISEGHVIHMMSSLKDASPMVREATLSLLSNCLTKDYSLERHVLPNILEMTIDPSNGPKKRAIKLLKDIYLRSTSKDNRLSIAASLLLPSQDDESTISELSRSVLEEIWLTAKPSGKADDSQQRLDRTQRATFMVDLLERVAQSTPRTEAFEKFFAYSLSPEIKGAATNSRICKDLVEDLLDSVIEAGTDNPQTRIMNTLAVFAKIKPTLFTVGNLQHLKMYITTIGTDEDIALLRPTVVVFRYVLPTLSSLQQAFADEVRGSLMTNLVKLATAAAAGMNRSKETLLDVVHCIWAISGMPDMDARRIFTALSSVIYQLFPLTTRNKELDLPLRKRLHGYLILLGAFGQVCNLDAHADAFFANLQNQALKNPEVAKQYITPVLAKKPAPSLLLLHAVRPFTMQAWDVGIREQALESMGGICHQSPELFMRAEVEKVVKLVFVNTDNDRLRLVALSFFNQYFTFAERRSETGAQIAVGKGATNGSARLETSFVANGNDSATMHLAQRFLPDFVDAALKNNNELAMLATNIIASISRQGLVHPKECGAALVALGTSRNLKVAQMASEEHRRIHEKQESYLEKEYMQAIHMAFQYQVDVFKDPHGMVEATHTPKLLKLFEALKTGKKASLKKFITNFVKQIDFDLSKLDAGSTSDAVLYARFCLENLALLDFPNWEELAVFLNAVETMVLSTTGPAVGVVIADELPKKYVNTEQPQDMLQQQLLEAGAMPPTSEAFPRASQLAPPTIDDDRLRQLTTACMILQLVWETRTFVRRCYTVKSNGPISQKDYPKPANRNNFITSKDLMERFVPIMRALDSRESMVKQCYEFADLLDVDREAFIDVDGDDTALGAGYETPTEDNNTPMPTSGRGRKRKSNVSLGNTPKKARGRSKKKRNSKTPDGDGESD